MAGFRSGSLGEPVPWVPCSQQVTPAVGRAGPRPAGCWGQAYRGARKPRPGLQGWPPKCCAQDGLKHRNVVLGD